MDRRALGEGEALARDREGHVPRRNEVHFDPRQYVVPACLVAEGVDRDVAIEFAVDSLEEVEVEGGGDTGGIVVGCNEALDRLHFVHADQELCVAAEKVAEAPEQVGRSSRNEIADRGTREETQLRNICDALGQIERPGEVGHDRLHCDGRELVGDRDRALSQIIARDIHRHVGGRLECFEQQGRLRCRSSAELDDRCPGMDARRNVRKDFLEQRRLGPRRVVGREARDLVEQFRPAPIVEPARRHRGDRRRQAGEDVFTESGIDPFSYLEQA
jgi:hypothetical protein